MTFKVGSISLKASLFEYLFQIYVRSLNNWISIRLHSHITCLFKWWQSMCETLQTSGSAPNDMCYHNCSFGSL